MASVDPESTAALRDACARFASGITVVTARALDGTDHGMTVSAFASLSLDPPLVLVCLDRSATALPHVHAAGVFAVSILAAGQEALSDRFADQTVDRFAGVDVVRAAEGPALIADAAAHMVCRVWAEHPGGDHVIIVGEVLSVRTHHDAPLVYFNRAYRTLGSQPRA